MRNDLEITIALLERTPAALDALLRGLPAEWTENNEGGETWNVPGVMAHLIHCEHVDWMPRLRMVPRVWRGTHVYTARPRRFRALRRRENAGPATG